MSCFVIKLIGVCRSPIRRSMLGLLVIAFVGIITIAEAKTSAAVAIQLPTPTPVPTPAASPTPYADDPVITVPGIPAVLPPNDPLPVAPDLKTPARPLPDNDRIGVDATRQLSLSLREAIELALKNNNDIDTTRNNSQISEFDLRASRGVYDPVIGSEGYYESATVPTASAIGGAVNGSVTQTRYFGSGGISGFSPRYGGSYSARFDSSRTTTSNTNAFLNPQYPTVLNFTYVQPLFRNRRIDGNRRNIEIAKKNIDMTDSQFLQRAMDVITLVEQSYWDLAYSLRNLQVQIDAVKQARLQLESNQRLVERGALAPIDIVAANAQITILEQNVYAAQELVTRTENTLKTLIFAERTDDGWKQPITPVSPINIASPQTTLDMAVNEALQNRPEIVQLETSSEINKIDQEYYKDQAKPQIDLVGSYSAQGLAGTETPAAINPATGLSRVPPNLVGGYGTSLGTMITQDYPTYRVGVTINLPWGNRTAKANLGRSYVEENRINNARAQTEQIIEAEVRNALQALRSAEARLNSAEVSRISAEQLAESEERLFRAGTTTFYLVLQRQTELLAARGRELQAQTDFNKSISEFNRATGRTLTANEVTVSDGTQDIITDTGRRFTVRSRFFVFEN